MSQMLQNCPWFAVPQTVVRGGLWARMKPRERGLYIALLHESERFSTREFQRSDPNLSAVCGVSSRSLRDARIRLQEYGLIRFSPGRSGYQYIICDPRTGKPFPGGAKDKKVPPREGGRQNHPPSSPAEPVGTPLSFP